jgi:hypothetical protein
MRAWPIVAALSACTGGPGARELGQGVAEVGETAADDGLEGEDDGGESTGADTEDVPAPCVPDHAIGAAGLLELVRADVGDPSRVDIEARRFVRYFSLAHLYDAGTCGAALDAHRQALAKALNALSWAPEIVAPVAIDPDATVMRVDLRDYDWSAATWATIVAADPYAIESTADEAVDVQAFTESPVPIVRADWFVAGATAPPLYHDLLGLPATRFLLEAELDVDVLGDVANDRVVRAGFVDSDMAHNNRMIQRHELAGGGGRAYWLSYDFTAATGTANLFAHPLDFEPDVRLHMFTLPNGMMAFLVTDAVGDRIDRVPDDVAIDPAEPDGDVVNGRSCLRCHDTGVVPHADALRAHVVASFEFDDATKQKVERLHPEADELVAVQAGDMAGYAAALALAGVAAGADEPMTQVDDDYRADVDLARAAAELGIATDQLIVEIGGLAPELQPLAQGEVPRDVFAASFAATVCALGLGRTTACPAE